MTSSKFWENCASSRGLIVFVAFFVIYLYILYVSGIQNTSSPIEDMKIGHEDVELRRTVSLEKCEYFSGTHGVIKQSDEKMRNVFLKDCPICFSETFDIIVPNDDTLHQMSLDALSCLYQRYVTSLQSLCVDQRRYGNVYYGGFQLCMDQNVAPMAGCIINSFNHNMSQRFEKQAKVILKCEVRKFFGEIKFSGQRLLGDILIMNITLDNFPALEVLVKKLNMTKVQQVIMEVHFDTHVESKGDHLNILSILRGLYKINYRIYWFDRNWKFVKDMRSRCYTINLLLSDVAVSTLKYKSKEIELPQIEPFGLKSIEKSERERFNAIYQNYISKHQILCKQMLRLGVIWDGGWDVCHDIQFRPKSPCIVYSFGIQNDFSFDDDMARIYGCDVYSFDPSMTAKTHRRSKHVMFYSVGIGNENKEVTVRGKKWKLKTLDSIQNELGHTNKRIDVLKMDVESSEKQSLPQMIKSGALKNVLQLCVEFHEYYDVGALRKLYEAGFRIFWTHLNPETDYYSNNRSYSYGWEIYFVNINLLT